jgi:hypothetical protein
LQDFQEPDGVMNGDTAFDFLKWIQGNWFCGLRIPLKNATPLDDAELDELKSWLAKP